MTEPLTVARPYAKAAFEFALAASAVKEWEACLMLLAALSENDEMKTWLSHPNTSFQEKVRGLAHVLEGKEWPEQIENFLFLLAKRGRLSLLPFVHHLFVYYRHRQERSAVVEVTSAYQLTETQLTELSKTLTRKLNAAVTLSTKVDRSLLGGVFIQAGDVVFDHSIRGRLNRMNDRVL